MDLLVKSNPATEAMMTRDIDMARKIASKIFGQSKNLKLSETITVEDLVGRSVDH